jgi:chorismate mutase
VFFVFKEEYMTTRGVRGATTTSADTASGILAATRELLLAITQANPGLQPDDLASAIFTASADLQAEYPAKAARELGWESVPLLCAQEIPVPGGLPRCIRLLIHWNTDRPQKDIRHVYLHEARRLRPDLAGSENPSNSELVSPDPIQPTLPTKEILP